MNTAGSHAWCEFALLLLVLCCVLLCWWSTCFPFFLSFFCNYCNELYIYVYRKKNINCETNGTKWMNKMRAHARFRVLFLIKGKNKTRNAKLSTEEWLEYKPGLSFNLCKHKTWHVSTAFRLVFIYSIFGLHNNEVPFKLWPSNMAHLYVVNIFAFSRAARSFTVFLYTIHT